MKFKSYYWAIIAAAVVAVLVIALPMLLSGSGNEDLTTSPHSPEELEELAQKVDFTPQVQAYTDLINANPQDITAVVGLGDTYSQNGKYPEAAEWHRKATELAPTDPLNYARLGEDYFAMGMVDLAQKEFDKGLAIDPNNQVLLLEIGLLSAQTGKTDEAIQIWQRAYDINPTSRYGAMAKNLLSNPTGGPEGDQTAPAP